MRYSKEDYANDTPERVSGRESEHTTAINTASLLSLISTVPALEGAVSVMHNKYWMPNGSKLYLDTGDVIETATPEGLNGRDTELHARVGERMIYDLVERYRRAVDSGNNPHDFIDATKRSGYVKVRSAKGEVLITPKSTGQHENYFAPGLVRPNGYREENRLRDELWSYLSTRGAWAGAGVVAQDGFRTTQRFEASSFGLQDNQINHGSKTVYKCNTDENRLEIRTGDGNMSSEVSIAVVDFTSLVLRMMEHGLFPEKLYVLFPGKTMRDSSVPGRLIQTRMGEMTGAEHQRRIAETALEFASQQKDTPKAEIAAAQYVVDACNDIELYDGSTDSLDIIADHAEWAAKLLYIRKHIGEKAVITAANLRAVKYDLQWEDISPTKSPSRRWYAEHNDPFTEAEILRAYTQPPHTRALARTALLRSEQSILGVDWNIVVVPGKRIHLPDPFEQAVDPRLTVNG